ncbi:Vacuolar protein sorting-associated protein 53 [Elasticomyces elasticus]|nr:Vacuolar protein sorting-associated protein 53 [Elasticomyces elasticus]
MALMGGHTLAQTNGSAPPNPLDAADYDPIDHLNTIFAHPSSLSSVSSVSTALRERQRDLDEDITSLVSAKTASDADSIRRIQAAKDELADLFAKIDGVRGRALQTERTITEMTADIKRLDGTKRNLTLSMTALKRLQMLTTAYEQLRGLSRSRQYRECAHLLQAVIQLMAHFKSYRSIDQIAALSKNVADVQRELLEQVCEDFETTFAKGEVAMKKGMLSEACLVVDALGDTARSRLVTWYCNTQLREYRQVFRGNDEAGSLDNIARRYSWFNRMLNTYDAEHAIIFPTYWHVNEMLANAFCEGTREDYKGILQRSMRRTDGQPPDVNLLLSCLQETLDFEHSLERRFASGESRSSFDTTVSSRDERSHGFSQAISEAFEPYLSIWVEQLATLMPKYRSQPLRNPDEEFQAQSVIPSSTELFHTYRITLAQCAKLSTGNRLLQLSKTFAKYLDAYSQQVLLYFLNERSGGRGPRVEDTVLILNTADYCYQTCNQLEEKVRARIDEDLKSSVDFQSQADSFIGIASAAVRALVRKVELDCEPSWREMRNTSWSKMESVGDQSPYVSELSRHIKDQGSEILKLLHKQQYARAFCDNVVDAMTNTYVTSLGHCRPISETGAEQMLLDSYVLKKGFTELMTLNAEPGTAPNPTFVKRVNQSMAKLDPLLKTLQVRSSPPEGLVQAYLIHIRDRSEPNFRKILELKGITRKQDQAHLVELFNAHKASPANETLQLTNPLVATLQLSASGPTGGGLSALSASAASHSTPALTGGRFDPSTLGSAIMSAARDGVDRFGSPALGGVTSIAASRATSPPLSPPPPPPTMQTISGLGTSEAKDAQAHPSINENLRNIGKFFKRDVGSFGRFGRGDDAKQ